MLINIQGTVNIKVSFEVDENFIHHFKRCIHSILQEQHSSYVKKTMLGSVEEAEQIRQMMKRLYIILGFNKRCKYYILNLFLSFIECSVKITLGDTSCGSMMQDLKEIVNSIIEDYLITNYFSDGIIFNIDLEKDVVE